MSQHDAWDREYQDQKMVTGKEEPQSDTKDFLRWLRKEQKVMLDGLLGLDLGCGTGRNSNFLATAGVKMTGYDISDTALNLARKRAELLGIHVQYENRDIGSTYAITKQSIDLVLDVMSSNSLLATGRETMLSELARVMKPGAYLYLKTLCKEGDANAKELLKRFPGPEADTYIMPALGITERVFTEVDLRALYEPHFSFLHLEKKTNYNRIDGRIYKRNYWICYLQRK